MPRAHRKSPPNRTRAMPAQRAARARRAKIVWGSLLASMTMVGGLLLVLDNRPAPRVDGLSMAALVASGAPDDIDGMLNVHPANELCTWTFN